MRKSITGLLGIQGWWKVTAITRDEKEIHLTLIHQRKTADCLRCHQRTCTGYDTQPSRTLSHTTIGHQLVFLHIAPRRFICPCTPSKPFREQLPGVHGSRSTTERFDRDLLLHLSGQAFKTVTKKLSLSYPSQRMRLTETIDPLVPRWDLVTSLHELHLGLDEHHLVNKRFVETITEVRKRIPLGILPNNRQVTIIGALSSCPPILRERVRSITLDMDNPTIAGARKVFPNAVIVIDHFHVIQDANRRLSNARLTEKEALNFERGKRGRGKIEIPGNLLRRGREHLTPQETIQLAAFLMRYPRLKIWYEHKERVRALYRLRDRKEAQDNSHSLSGS